jgi:hypothetical protein
MEKEEVIEQKPEATGTSEDQAVSEQPIPVESIEDRINRLASEYIQQVTQKAILTDEQKEELIDQTKYRILAERSQAIQVLNEALIELKNLKWHDVQPCSLLDISQTKINGQLISQRARPGMIGGLRDIYFVRFGNFIQTKNKGWIYRPTNDQMLSVVRRLRKKEQCEQIANSLRLKFRGNKVEYSDKSIGYEETEELKELKLDLENQLNELLKSV